MNTLNIIQNIFRDIIDDCALVLSIESTPDDIEAWDSLAHINIIAACEEEFGVKFDIREITSIKGVDDLVQTIERKIEQ